MPDDSHQESPRTARRHAAQVIRLGFVPLLDAAPLLVAEALGLFEAVGLNVALSAEPSWATLRDRIAFGGLEGAHMLSPMPIALAAGLGGVQADITVACGLGRQGNAITLTPKLASAFAQQGGKALRGATLSVVFPFSSHNYLLRHWLARQGLDADQDIRLVVVPPPQVAAFLASGRIDGFCTGAPWGSHSVAIGAGRVIMNTGDIWPGHPEKLLGFDSAWAKANREAAIGITAATIAAARWLDEPENHDDAVRILRSRAFAHLEAETIAKGLGSVGQLSFRDATFPFRSEAEWWRGQMRRWGHLPAAADSAALLDSWDPDLWRAAAGRIGEPEPLHPPQSTPPLE
ncbi:ABC transporter substrate-binding protein [Rhodovarius crocodyli]|uniref:ABC transporter substrate-binding protein n=1 Tax=Rhodovarius crocodyli TaxID=1979269 RepID=A0A437MNL9_9PROT|nr:ABC transporter substrate-binding protein [Rhodovarius crocodyli]RVT99254.1 ABC transporter substrate-binding protein [Rhodovarius crocodyli]